MENNTFSLEEEVRCGFKVSEKRKKIWKTQLDIALEVKRICEKHNIAYFIMWGTLLGAVRHKGYIPWDDDFDIAFLRKDYEKFCKIAREEIKYPFFFQDALSDREFFIGYARIRDSRTTGWILWNPSPSYNNGIYIDIFPFDVIPSNKYIWKIQAFLINHFLRKLAKYNSLTYKEKCEKKIRYRKLVFCHKVCCRMFNWIRYPEKIGGVYMPADIEKGYWFNAEDMKNFIEMPFEDTTFRAPKGYKRMLKNAYGDYMKFPPKNKCGRWHERQLVFEPDMPYTEFYKNKMRKRSIVKK